MSVAKTAKKRRRPSDARLAAVAAMLPPEALKEIRENLAKPPAPKKPVGRPSEASLTGTMIGKWRVGPKADRSGRTAYICLCDGCANVAIVEASNLSRGQSTQCRRQGAKAIRTLIQITERT